MELLANQTVSDDDQVRLKLADDLIVHNAAIMFHRSVWFILPILGILLILVSTIRSSETPIDVQVRATNVMWKIANPEPGSTPVVDWDMYTSGSLIHYVKSVLMDPDNNPYQSETLERDLLLLPCSTNNPVKVQGIPLPDKCHMGISFADSTQAEIDYQWREEFSPAPAINWNLSFQGRGLNYDGKLISDTCTRSTRIIGVRKRLQRGALYDIPIEGLGNWHLPHPIRISELSFNIENSEIPESRSSIISGQIRLLKTNDSTILLNEGDRLRLKFKEPVDLYLSTIPGYVNIRTNGIVTTLDCGTQALGDNINKMPRMLKSITDESPYLLTLIAIVLPLLMAMVIRQKKSI